MPPAPGQVTPVVHMLILLAMNPAVFPFCWKELWEPLVFACILERVMFTLGLCCLCWTLMASKAFSIGVELGLAFWSFSVRRLLHGPQALLNELRKADAERRRSRQGPPETTARTVQRKPPEHRQCSDLSRLRAEQTRRWSELQEPWLLRRRERTKRRAAAKRQRMNHFLRQNAYVTALVLLGAKTQVTDTPAGLILQHKWIVASSATEGVLRLHLTGTLQLLFAQASTDIVDVIP